MGTYQLESSGDYRNEGWANVGGQPSIWQGWSNVSDSYYSTCPSYKGRATVKFPIDITSIPDGAVITSVTFYIRVRKDSSASRSVTVNILSSDKTEHFTSRTIRPTTSFVTYEVATYKKDPLNRVWDIERLNKLLVQCFSYSYSSAAIHVSRFYAVVNYRVRPVAVLTAPSGSSFTPSPTLIWSYSQADGDLQGKADYKIFSDTVASGQTFDPTRSVSLYKGTVTGDKTTLILPTALAPGSYYAYVRVYSSYGAVSAWVGRPFSIAAPAPGIPNVVATPDNANSKIVLSIQDTSNLLTVVQSDAEQDSDRDEYVTTNCTVARNTSQFVGDGTVSYSLTASSAATMSILSTFVPVTPGAAMTARAQAKSAVTGRTVNLVVSYFDVNFASIGTPVTTAITDTTTGWTEAVGTFTVPVSPIGISYAKVKYEVVSPANAEVHYVDHLGLMYGSSSRWSHGGHMSRNILDSDYAGSPGDASWVAASGTAKSTLTSETRTGAHSSRAMRLTPTAVTGTIAFRATGTQFSATSAGTAYTLNKPAGVTTGDLMIAYITTDTFGTITPPAGWTAVNSAATDDGTTDICLFVLMRTAGGSEPSTWTDGSLVTSSTRVNARVIAYSGCADASQQLYAESVAIRTTDTPLTMQSAYLTNGDPNAWRVSAFAVRDDVASGTWTATEKRLSDLGGISYVGTSATWSNSDYGSTYTINKPPNIVSGDLMIASMSFWGNGPVSAPTGWTIVSTNPGTTSSGNFEATTSVMKRTATGSEPSSWTGNLTGGTQWAERISSVIAYRGADTAANQFIATGDTDIGGYTTNVTTATVNNTDSSAWRMCVFALQSVYAQTCTSNEIIERVDDKVTGGTRQMLAIYDSNGAIGTGNTNRTATWSSSDHGGGTAWIGIIKPLGTGGAGGPAQTERVDESVGAADPRIVTGIYDSNGGVAADSASVMATFTPGSGSTIYSMASWHGLLKPSTTSAAGTVQVTMTNTVDISTVDDDVFELSDNKMTVGAAFIGTSPGTPYLRMYFYRANALLSTAVGVGTGFDSTQWMPSSATFDIPDGTTRVKAELYSPSVAASENVDIDMVNISFGSSPVWRNGTFRATHPIWSKPIIEYQDDDGTGFTDWAPLRGISASPPVYDQRTGLISYDDHTVVPLVTRQYRVKTYSYGLLGDSFASEFCTPVASAPVVADHWWLKNINDPTDNLILPVQAFPSTGTGTSGADTVVPVNTANTASVFQPIGSDYPLVLTEGYKSDTIDLSLVIQRLGWAAVRKLLKSGLTLFLQSDVDNAWWVRPINNMDSSTILSASRKSDPYRIVNLSFVEVQPEG